MWTIHVTTDTILQYIAALEKAQLQAARAEMPIPDNYLIMVATKAVLLLLSPGQQGLGGSRKGLQILDEVVQNLQKDRHEGDHPDPGWGKGGGTIRRRGDFRCQRVEVTSRGTPHPGHCGRLRRFF